MIPLPKLASPALRALASVNIHFLEDLSKFQENEIMELHDMGPNAMSKLKEVMNLKNIQFKKKN